MAVDDTTYAGADEGERHRGGGMVGEVEGYLWMQRWAADATREEEAATVGEHCGSGNGVWCVFYRTLLDEASKIWEVIRKSLETC